MIRRTPASFVTSNETRQEARVPNIFDRVNASFYRTHRLFREHAGGTIFTFLATVLFRGSNVVTDLSETVSGW